MKSILLLAFALMSAGAAVAGPKVSCSAQSNQVVSYDHQTKKTTEREIWMVSCSAKDQKPLSESYATFHEAMEAIETYRAHAAGECAGSCDRECQDKCFKKGECPYGWKP